jgi:hypothetical protein
MPKMSASLAEQLAVQQANPNFHQFEHLMSKVIVSVQNRRK